MKASETIAVEIRLNAKLWADFCMAVQESTEFTPDQIIESAMRDLLIRYKCNQIAKEYEPE